MKVQTKVLLLLTGVVVFFLGIFVFLTMEEEKEANLYLQKIREKTTQSFDTILQLKGESLANYAYDYSYWDEMVEFVAAPDPAWGDQNIEQSFGTYGTTAGWVFDVHFSPVYFASTLENKEEVKNLLPSPLIEKLFKENKFCHFFLKTAEGPVEFRGASIHPSADDQRITPAKGYFIVSRLWDEAHLQTLSEMTRTLVTLRDPISEVPYETAEDKKTGTLRFSIPLTDWKNEPIVRLDVSQKNDIILQLNQANQKRFWIQLLFGLVLLTLLSLFLLRWVSRPISALSASLKKEDARHLTPLQKEKSEFGHIARLILQFFEQKKKLAQEISDRKKAEQALEKEKEFLTVTLRSISDGVLVTNLEGKIILMNRQAEKMTDWKFEEAANKPLSEVFHLINKETRVNTETSIEKIVRKEFLIVERDQNILVSRKGREKRIAEFLTPLKDKESKVIGIVIVFRDITLEKKMEQEMLKASKLETISVLAGGIAHDFNNLLAVILGNISLGKIDISEKNLSRLPLFIEEAEKACLRAKNLTARLLTFAKGGAPVLKSTSMEELIHEAVDFALSGSNVQCQYHLAPDLWLANIDANQISQVLHNIVINACQAMPKGGILEVRAENSAKGPANILPVMIKNFVKISVQDHGTGIKEEHLQKIFDPFFTTKTKGSGMGLATSYSIVKNHNGVIGVESKLGEGTTFHIYLPASENQQRGEKKQEEKPFVGSGRILILEDEPVVEKMLRQMLTRLGYESESVSDGNLLIDRYIAAKKEGKPFTGLIMDLTIPGGMGGKEAIQKLLQIDPDVKAIVSSGYSSDPIMAEYKKFGFSGVIAKPYLIQHLSEVLHDLFEQKHAA